MLFITAPIETLTYVQSVDKAINGQEAFNLVIQNEQSYCQGGNRHYDLIFLDLDMPVLNGYEACNYIKNHYNKLNQNLVES